MRGWKVVSATDSQMVQEKNTYIERNKSKCAKDEQLVNLQTRYGKDSTGSSTGFSGSVGHGRARKDFECL